MAFRFATGTNLIGCGQKRCPKNGGLDLRFGFTENFLVLEFGGWLKWWVFLLFVFMCVCLFIFFFFGGLLLGSNCLGRYLSYTLFYTHSKIYNWKCNLQTTVTVCVYVKKSFFLFKIRNRTILRNIFPNYILNKNSHLCSPTPDWVCG